MLDIKELAEGKSDLIVTVEFSVLCGMNSLFVTRSQRNIKYFYFNDRIFSLLLNIRLPSFRATWVCQPRAFSHASGVYRLDGGFLSLVSG